MVDTSERIIVLTALILVTVMVWAPNSGPPRTIVTVKDLEIKIVTLRENYTLGESFTADAFLVNNRSEEVWIKPISSIIIVGYSLNGTDPIAEVSHISVTKDLIRIPANSTRKIQSRVFKPLFLGEFRISCLGLKKTVLIREPLKIGQGIGPLVVDWLDPEYALSRGIKGYVNISYVSEIPARIIVSPGKVIHYTIQLQLIPHVPEFTETEILLDPENASHFRKDYVLLKDYIRYSPNGTILLRVDEPRNVTMVLSVPDGSTGMSVHPRYMLGIGIFADVPVASASGVGLHRIPRDEG